MYRFKIWIHCIYSIVCLKNCVRSERWLRVCVNEVCYDCSQTLAAYTVLHAHYRIYYIRWIQTLNLCNTIHSKLRQCSIFDVRGLFHCRKAVYKYLNRLLLVIFLMKIHKLNMDLNFNFALVTIKLCISFFRLFVTTVLTTSAKHSWTVIGVLNLTMNPKHRNTSSYFQKNIQKYLNPRLSFVIHCRAFLNI